MPTERRREQAGGRELTEARVRAIRRGLLRWYDRHQRVLPWRAGRGERADAYHVLVSEAMLQQTQVATVLPYFERFVSELPTLADLARADEQRVLRLWQGLGYYRRARHLHAAAKAIERDHGGRVPASVEELLKLPGVGRYTAGAIASIAFGKRAAILDGNVARVLARLFVIDRPVDDTSTKRVMWALAERLVPVRRPGDFNQAMMELGALVCVRAKPDCAACPLARLCEAQSQGRVAELPVPAKRKAPMSVHHHVIAIRRRGKWLFHQRPNDGLWSGMWQMPTAEHWSADAEPEQMARWVEERFGLKVQADDCVGGFIHQTTHRAIKFHVWNAEVLSGRLRRGSGVWRRLDAVDDLPMSNPQRRVIGLVNRSEVGSCHD